MSDRMDFINIVPLYVDDTEFTISEIRRQAAKCHIPKFAISMSFHPEGTPASVRAEKMLKALERIMEGTRDIAGIEMGVLIQSTQGHGWSGPVPLTDEPWQRIVMLDGKESSRMCPSDADFRAYVLDCIRKTCALGPKFLFLDDDFGLRHGECLCPNCLQAFNEATGKSRSFLEAAEAIRAQPGNSPEMRILGALRKELAVSFAQEIRQAIDEVDESIWVICCCPGAGQGFENDVVKALSTPKAPAALRVCNASYGHHNPGDFQWFISRTRVVQFHVPSAARYYDESDTFPQNYYSESAAQFNLHLTNAILSGLKGAKLWMSEFTLPESTGSQSRYEAVLEKNWRFFDELLRNMDGAKYKGVAAPLFQAGNLLHPLTNGIDQITDWNVLLLGPFGFPTRYVPSGEGGIYALTSEQAENLSDADLKTLFAGPLLVDSLAARILDKRGFAPLMGVRVVNDPKFFFKGEYEEESRRRYGLMWDANMTKLECVSTSAEVLTWCILGDTRGKGPIEKVSPCMTAFENELGGKVVTLAWSAHTPFYKGFTPRSQAMLRRALNWLAGGCLDYVFATDHHVMVRHCVTADGADLVALANLGEDPVNEFRFQLSSEPSKCEALQADGTWKRLPFAYDNETLTLQLPHLAVEEIYVLRLQRK